MRFERDTKIFDTERPFRESYNPDELPGREEELDAFENYLQCVINGDPPKNIFVYGKSGVGKTVCTKEITSELEQASERYDDVDVTTFRLSCRKFGSTFQVVTNLVNTVREELGKQKINFDGRGADYAFERLWEEFDSVGGAILVVLDEIDKLSSDDLLYEIPRANDEDNVTDAEPGIIGISNDLHFQKELSTEVKDTLCEEELVFDPYEKDELLEILDSRAQEAFYDNVLEHNTEDSYGPILNYCAKQGAQDTGSARQALRLLYKAGEIARDEDGAESIDVAHVKNAKVELERGNLVEAMRDLTTQGHLSLLAVATLEIRNKTPAKMSGVYDRYQRIAQKVGYSNTNTQRRVKDQLDSLVEDYGFVVKSRKNKGANGGSYDEYRLSENVSTTLVLEALSEVEVVGGYADQYRNASPNQTQLSV